VYKRQGPEHSHVVSSTAIHSALAQFRASEKVSSTDHDRDLGFFGTFGDFAGDTGNHVRVDSEGTPTKCFAGKFQKYSTTAFGHVGTFPLRSLA